MMRTFTAEQLKTILDNHELWLSDSTQGVYADLSDADLSNCNLRYADLRYADFRHADLRYAYLRGADLRHAYLRYADLRHADLSDANLRHADLRGADLSNTNILRFQFNKHQSIYTPDGSLTIGCHCLPITKWAETYKDIGFNEGYSDEEIAAYGDFIKTCLRIFKNGT